MIWLSVFLLIPAISYAGCEVTIDGNCRLDVDIIQHIGLGAEPSTSPSDTMTSYFDTALGKLRCSEDGGSYVDCIGGAGVVYDTVANLPAAPSAGDQAGINDGSSVSDCTVGGGSNYNLCVYDGANWVIVGDGTSAGGGNSIFFEKAGVSFADNQSSDIYLDTDNDLIFTGSGQNINIVLNDTPTTNNLIVSGSLSAGDFILTGSSFTVSSGSINLGDDDLVSTGSLSFLGGMTGDVVGNADTATALAVNPTACTNQFARDLDADGTITCATVDDASVANNITIDLATAATALNANPTDCAANQFAQSIVASGNLTCSAIIDADVPNDITIDLATQASTLATARTIGITGDVVWNVSFDGSMNTTASSTIQTNSVALGTDTTGNYVSSATASQGLLVTGTEGASVGLADCAANQIMKRNAGDTAWECAADSGGAETNSLETVTTGIATTEIPIGTAVDTVVYSSLSGDVTMANNGAVTIQPNSVTLETDTIGDFVNSITAGTNITSTGATSGENISHTLSVDDAFLVNNAPDTTNSELTAAGFVTSNGSITSSTGSINFGSEELVTTGSITIKADNVGLVAGANEDVSLYYDATEGGWATASQFGIYSTGSTEFLGNSFIVHTLDGTCTVVTVSDDNSIAGSSITCP